MERFNRINPFCKRESHDAMSVMTYRILTIATWLLVVIPSVCYTYEPPHDDILPRRTIWGQNEFYATGYTLNPLIASIYWVGLFIFQIGYVWHLFSSNVDYVNAAAGVGSHFILNNLLQFGFVMLFVRSHFFWAEVLLIINFFNLSSLYFRHPVLPCFIHVPTVSGPLAWNFIALYWNGAIMFHNDSLTAHILANIAIWGILVYGMFFLVTFKDYTMGFALSILTASLGVGQFLRQVVAFQWIFAFTIMAVLFLCTLVVAFPSIFGKEIRFTREPVVTDDRERAPLLEGN